MDDRLEDIARHRSNDPDIKWLVEQLLCCRRDLEHLRDALRRLIVDETGNAS